MFSAREVEGHRHDILMIVDHASNHVPADIDLGIAPALLDEHVAIDIGTEPLARAIGARLGCGGFLGAVSRLVVDLNRESDAASLIPEHSDGHWISGNRALDPAARAQRIARFWTPYHDAIAARIARYRPRLILALHSFTPMLRSSGEARPWQVGLLYNEDDRGARFAIPRLEALGVVTGDNLPYSGKLLNATVNRHAEANGIAYLNFEVRQDLIADEAGVERWADLLSPLVADAAEALG